MISLYSDVIWGANQDAWGSIEDRVAKTHRIFIFIGYLPQNGPIISGSFAENDLQIKASYGSLPPCNSIPRLLGGCSVCCKRRLLRVFQDVLLRVMHGVAMKMHPVAMKMHPVAMSSSLPKLLGVCIVCCFVCCYASCCICRCVPCSVCCMWWQ